jgi:hypothetical protein
MNTPDDLTIVPERSDNSTQTFDALMAQAARAIEARRTPFDPYKNILALQAIQKYRNAGFWPLPPTCRTYSESVMAQAEGDMEAVLAAFPRLTTYTKGSAG